MAQLIASGSRRISQLTSVSGVSGSTSMPIVMGGDTVQVSHTDFLNTTVFNKTNTYTQPNTFNSQTNLSNTLVSGDLRVSGNLTANQYIISSSVSHITSSFSSGSTIFGDTDDDTHQFTGSVSINGNLNAESITASLSYDNITDKPTLVSSSQQVLDYGIFATTGSNIFVGNQTITGSLIVSGSSTFTNIGLAKFTGSIGVSGSVNADSFTLDATSTSTIPALNSTFNLDLAGSTSTFIEKSLVLGDGKVLVAGRFTTIDGHITNDIAKLNSDGTIDTSFAAPIFSGGTFSGDAGGFINTFVTQSDDRIVVGGNFVGVGGSARRGLARLETNGTLDTTFETQSFSSFSTAAGVRDIVIQNDDKIVCVGDFISGSRRVNTDGTLDTSFDIGREAILQFNNQPTAFNNGDFYSVALLDSGSEQAILIGGRFAAWGSFSNYDFLVKLTPSGALDFGFAGSNLDLAWVNGDRIEKIKVDSDNNIYIAGRFRDTGIGNHAGFAIVLPTDDVGDGRGALDTGFRTYITGSFVNDFDFYDGDKILLGGSFTTFGNPSFSTTSANRFAIIRKNTGGLISNWSSDGLASTYNLNTGAVNSVTLLPNDNVLLGGSFTSASFPSTARDGLASFKLAGLGVVTATTDYSITADTDRLLISSSNTHFSGNVNISGSITSQGFLNKNIITNNISIPSNHNGLLVGPITLEGGLTMGEDSTLSII